MALEFKKGDVVICAQSGDYDKPRPAIIVQSDLFNPTHSSITICPITSHLIDTPLFRIELYPSTDNGLKHHSQIMVDKISSLSKEKIQQKIGLLSSAEIKKVQDAIKLWLDL